MNNPQASVFQSVWENHRKCVDEREISTPTLHTIDNRFYLSSHVLGTTFGVQSKDTELAESFASLAEALTNAELDIMSDLNGIQGSSIDLQGYFFPADEVVQAIMRPSETFNQILAAFVE